MKIEEVIEDIKKRYIGWSPLIGPGMSIGVRDGKKVNFYNTGLACVESQNLIDENTKFHAASLAKQITAFCITYLECQGKLSSEDFAIDHLPDLIPQCAEEIKIKHLLNHTSGLKDQWVLLSLAGWKSYEPISMDDITYLIRRQQTLNFTPGVSHSYCNTGYTILALLVEKVVGTSFSKFVTEKILMPARMVNSRIKTEFNESKTGDALAYFLKEIDGKEKKFYRSLPPLSVYGATSLITTSCDLIRWGQYLNKLEKSSPKLFRSFNEKGTLASRKSINYGRGIIHWKFKGENAIFHGGWDYGFSSFFLHFPEREVSISILANCYEPNLETIAFFIASSILKLGSLVENDIQCRLKPVTIEEASETNDNNHSYEGLYQCLDDLDIKPIKLHGNILYLDIAQGFELIDIGSQKYAVQGTMVELNFTDDDQMIFSSFGNDKIYKKLPSIKNTLDKKRITGKYFSNELNITCETILLNDEINFIFPRNEVIKLDDLGGDLYSFGGMLVNFIVDDIGEVSSFNISHPRAKSIIFNKLNNVTYNE